jgi:hypothetical protein
VKKEELFFSNTKIRPVPKNQKKAVNEPNDTGTYVL